jgi:hypothetical protein
MPCTICGAVGVNKSTCPFNLSVISPSDKHNSAPLQSGLEPRRDLGLGLGSKPKVKVQALVKPKPKPKLKPDLLPDKTKQPGQSKVQIPDLAESLSNLSIASSDPVLDIATREALTLFPHDKKQQDAYINDVLMLALPLVSVPHDDLPKQRAKERMEDVKKRRTAIKNKCEICLKGIRLRDRLGADTSKWAAVAAMCEACHEEIGNFYHTQLPGSQTYNRYHVKGSLPVDVLLNNGIKNDYYNHTMYEGAKYWRDAAMRRSLLSAPNAPSRK